MAEYVNSNEETIDVGEPIIFENKTEASFDVSVGVVFRKSGLYRVSVYGRNVFIQNEPERKKGKWIENTFCSECGWIHEVESGFIGSVEDFNYCPNCGADMRKKEPEHKGHTMEEFMYGQDPGSLEDGSL